MLCSPLHSFHFHVKSNSRKEKNLNPDKRELQEALEVYEVRFEIQKKLILF